MSSGPRGMTSLVLVVVAALVAAVLTGSTQVGATAATQSGVTSLSAPNVQPGKRPASSTKAQLVGTVRFSPARAGRSVQIQRSTDGLVWSNYGKPRKQNGSGVVTFTGPAYRDLPAPLADAAYLYRGVAKATGGLARFESSPQSAAAWAPKFRDEFSGTSLGDNWVDRRPESKECAKVGDRRARKVARGTLRLMVKLDPRKKRRVCKTSYGKFRYYLNGQVSSQQADVGAFTHGTYSARIKFHKNRGAHGAFWMQPVVRRDRARPADAGAEIDIAEFFGRGYPQGGLASFVYNYAITKRHKLVKIGGMAPAATRMLPRRDSWWTRFHVFSLEWTRSAYRFSVDGRVHSVLRRGVTSVDEYMILGLMTSAWELRQAQRAGVRPTGTMQVDWVRVWQQD